MAGIEDCPHCGCGNAEDYERCMACAMSPAESPKGAGPEECEVRQAPIEPDGWYRVGTGGKSGPYKSLREAMVRSGV
jgi:hypothetical protein